MDLMLVEQPVDCPFCGESLTILLDPSAGTQSYIEDCQVCCQPMQVRFDTADDQVLNLEVHCAS